MVRFCGFCLALVCSEPPGTAKKLSCLDGRFVSHETPLAIAPQTQHPTYNFMFAFALTRKSSLFCVNLVETQMQMLFILVVTLDTTLRPNLRSTCLRCLVCEGESFLSAQAGSFPEEHGTLPGFDRARHFEEVVVDADPGDARHVSGPRTRAVNRRIEPHRVNVPVRTQNLQNNA